MENEESLDSPFNFYQNNLQPKDYSEKNDNLLTYFDIFNSRNYFSILGLSHNNIIVSKQSLIKIASMIDANPEEYISFTNNNDTKITSLYLFQKHNNNIIVDDNEENINSEDNNDTDDGFKKVENLEDSLFDPEVYKKCFWFNLFLLFCAIWDFLFYIYIITFTIYKAHFFTIYTLILSLLSEFTGLYGLLKCKQKNFSGYILKTITILVPILVLIGILIYLASDVKFNLYWVKIIIDVLTIAISIILIAFVTGLIKAEINIFNNEESINQIDQNLVKESKNEVKEQSDTTFKF